MIEQNKMKIEKKLVASLVLVMLIGMATIVPLMTLMTTAKAQTDDPWFSIEIDNAYFSADVVNDAYYLCTSIFGPKQSINLDAVSQQEGVRIEYFEVIFYTDDAQLDRNFICIGGNNSYVEDPEKFMELAREGWFNSFGYRSGGFNFYTDLPFQSSILDSMEEVPYHIGQSAPEIRDNSPLADECGAIVAAIEDKQTIYLDVIRIGYTHFDGEAIVISTSNDPVIVQHLELTKNGNAFMFGNMENIEKSLSYIKVTPETIANITPETLASARENNASQVLGD